jgi:GTP diphosphokinase / guanosine-3',5'-bis(diphosphate) 3'-diphosphatase
MLDPELRSSPPNPAPNDDRVLELLPPGAPVPPRYRQVCEQLRDWGLPGELVQLGLVMRRVERGAIAPAQLAPLLGEVAAEVAAALAAFGGPPRPALRAIEPAWKLFMLAYLHPSAAVLKIAELLMRLRYSQDADVAIGDETIGAAAGVCARLGMWDMRAELLDTRARLADPHLAQRARSLLDASQTARERFFEAFRGPLAELLRDQGIAARIERRQRPVSYLIEHGLESVQGSLPWSDIVVVLIEDAQECYRALGAINSAYPVIGSQIRDYIGGPRENGYQAIHTTVEYTAATEDSRPAPVDIRISTAAMYRYNRRGYLAELAGAAPPARRKLWWHERQRWLDAYHGASQELFVFTPKGEAIFLPRGATVVDFAVRVHRDLGVYCRGGLVNGVRVSPGERLERGDICEVLIEHTGAPIDRRLLDLAGTAYTRSRIRGALQKDSSGVARGRHTFHQVLTQRMEQQEVHASTTAIDQQVAALCLARAYHSTDAFYRAVARGEAAPDQLIRVIIDGLLIPRLILDAIPAEVRARAGHIRLAQCCRPRPSQTAIAVPIHAGRQLKIHAAGCPRVAEPAYAVAWRQAEQQAYAADVLYEGWDRPGLIHQLTGAVYTVGGVNIRSFNADVPEPSLARIRFSFEVPSREQLDQVQRALESLPERRHVELRAATLIDEGFRITTPLSNPYGPHPVGRRPFFVGRSAEVRRILAHLDGQGARHLLIRGPKRIGKSSLLEHLARYHLDQFKMIARLDLQSLPTGELRLDRLLGRIADLLVQRAGVRGRSAQIDTAGLTRDPLRAFGRFLCDLHDPHDSERFVVLLDELGVVASRLRSADNGRGPAREFFDQWRALLNDECVYSRLAFVAALPDYSLERVLASGAPDVSERTSLRIGELGTPIRLGILDTADARDLITAPVGSHLDYAPADLALLLVETGGHPYYIHLVCSQIITAIQVQQRKTGLRFHERQAIPAEVVRDGIQAVFAHEDAFYHILADSTPGTTGVLRAVAALGGEGQWLVERTQVREWLDRKCRGVGLHAITWALEERPDLLFEDGDRVGIRVALVARWLRSHA